MRKTNTPLYPRPQRDRGFFGYRPDKPTPAMSKQRAEQVFQGPPKAAFSFDTQGQPKNNDHSKRGVSR